MALLAALVSLVCVIASGRRLALAAAPGVLDLDLLRQAILEGGGTSALVRGLAGDEGARWVRETLEATSLPGGEVREALLGEQLLDLDWTLQRWARVPRVSASIATSSGFLCACLSLVDALGDDALATFQGFPVAPAVTALGCGLAGAAFCVAVHVRVRHLSRSSRLSADRLADLLRRLPQE